MTLRKRTGKPGVLQSMGSPSRTRLSNRTRKRSPGDLSVDQMWGGQRVKLKVMLRCLTRSDSGKMVLVTAMGGPGEGAVWGWRSRELRWL